MHVYILKFGDSSVVVENFRNAIRHASARLFPDAFQRERLRQSRDRPDLNAVGASGSFQHFLRHYNSLNDCLEFKVEQHFTRMPPGESSLVKCFDLNEGFDPSYCLHKAIWDHAASDKDVRSDIAKSLEAEILLGLRTLRSKADDARCLDDLRDLIGKVGGHEVLPTFGTPSSILDAAPSRTSSIFLEVADALERELKR